MLSTMKFRFPSVITFANSFRAITRCDYRNASTLPITGRKPWSHSMNDLYRRISPAGDPTVSMFPILDKWALEGRPIDKEQLQVIIKELRYYKRYSHALQLSMWMSEKRFFKLASRDVAIRLDLIAKVHGIEKAENYFNNVPVQLRVLEVYGALLNCYTSVKSVEKSEATMQKMRDLGFAETSLAYNVMLNLYYQTGNREKFDVLVNEMEEKGIGLDKYSVGIRLSAHSAVSDIQGIDKILERIESDPMFLLDWTVYAVAANGYLKAGLPDRALAMLRKSEGMINGKKRGKAYVFLITQYAATGKKDEVLRLWKLYKKKEKVYNMGYMSVIPSILKFGDFETAEKIFDEWESRNLTYDLRIPNALIGAYSRKGLMEKAETTINNVISKGKEPDAIMWYYMATGYLQINQPAKAVEPIKKALLVCQSWWKPRKIFFATCLKYLKDEGNVKAAEEIIGLLGRKDIVSMEVHDRLLKYIRDEEMDLDALRALNDEELAENGEVHGLLEVVKDSSNCT
ncbi:hypothetical protein HS088_TW05G00473 [Tripterygium wilfordii]|uniref:Pentatricopeptide repeat-containing protein n=1 Tax=Tripterygium wilfordii TaxID=458696 RepID=A0A7J7DNS2_TRIWF|nr:pentatricopeptide repeat-containing protein At2g20710, mitochondrial-like [Tripterygium wilfordii]KAF5747746.1 hypothetical protein HS088_TW05G00473 [Tripterygium wilfordii]